jgi:hypothetical protein
MIVDKYDNYVQKCMCQLCGFNIIARWLDNFKNYDYELSK